MHPHEQPGPPPTNAQRLVQETIAVDEAAEDPPASALHREGLPLTEVDTVEPDWSALGEEEPLARPPSTATSSTTPPSTATPAKARPATATPTATPATDVVRFGVDLGGVLWPFVRDDDLSAELALSIGPLEAARDWMASLVRRIGADNVFIVSKVGGRGERMWAQVLHESGFYHDTGMRSENVFWVRERTGEFGKAPMVWRLQLTHFVDDRSDVLSDIKLYFLERDRAEPVLYLVPTTTWHSSSREAFPTDHDRDRAQRGVYSLGTAVFAEHLGEVPLPDPAARPTAH